jgi:hypothetical protein
MTAHPGGVPDEAGIIGGEVYSMPKAGGVPTSLLKGNVGWMLATAGGMVVGRMDKLVLLS